jgi:muramidase (phage lysozyme)
VTRATDLPQEARAFLDALAVGESSASDDDAAYSILFGGGHFEAPPWPEGFPQWSGRVYNGWMTHAAGRYQDEPQTWRQQQEKLGLPDFSPESQDKANWDLAETVYHARTSKQLLAQLVAKELSGIAGQLHSTWTSLSEETFPERYTAALSAIIPPTSPS